MSNSTPPPYEPGQPYQPYQAGQPGQPEYLASGPGQATAPPAGPRRGRRNALIAGGFVGAVAVIGGGAWAASWYLGSGPSAAEILPATTVAYAQVNLDPSGDQKIAALKMLNKFPAFKQQTGISSTDDLRQKAFKEIQSDGSCPGVDYDADIKPWLGDRISVAAVDEGGTTPVDVVVLQVSDEGKATAGLKKLASCDDPGGDTSAYVVKDGWAVLASTRSEAQKVFDEADKATLADDDDYQRLTKAAGSTGVLTAYVAPDAGKDLAALMGGDGSEAGAQTDALKDFGGVAVQVRFSGGGLEVEYAGTDKDGKTGDLLSDDGAQEVRDLPTGTAAALGTGLKSGWAGRALDAVASTLGTSRADLVSEAQQATGLTLPDDAETLLGSSFALAVSGDIDVDKIVNSGDPSSVPVGIKVTGRADDVEGVLGKLQTSTGQASLLKSTSAGDQVAFGPSDAWNAQLVKNGSLGDSSTFTDVVPDAAKAQSIFYLDVDTHDWLVKALESTGASSDDIANVKPLKALGIAAWVDGGTTHGVLRLTTN